MDRETTLSTGELRDQSFRLRAWIRTRLWAQVLVGMVAGFAVGVLLGPDVGWLSPQTSEMLGAWLALPGRIFLGLIAMVLVPLIFASIVGGLTGVPTGAELKSVGLKLTAFIVATTLAATWLGAGLALWLEPGAGLVLPATAAAEAPAPSQPFDIRNAPDIIAGILPTNPTASIVRGEMLAVVVLALLVGLAAMQVERERVEPFLRFLGALLSVAMVIVKWAMFLAPFAVFGLMADLVMRVGLETIVGLSAYVGTVLVGLAILLVFYIAIAALSGVGPVRFLREAGGNLLLAFSTSSSSAVMPVTINTAIRLGTPETIASLVVPLGATMNMAGTALYQTIAILFLAQVSGVDLDLGQIALITVTLVASSIGAPGAPGVSIGILVTVAAGFGIPSAGLVIVLGVDRLLDMSRTVVNVTGDLAACVLLRREEGGGRQARATADIG